MGTFRKTTDLERLSPVTALLACGLLLGLLTACGAQTAGSSPQINTAASSPQINAAIAPDYDYAIVRAYFATDRNMTGDPDPKEKFGGDRGELVYGICKVSIPRDHKMGALEEPSIWRLEFSEDPAEHVVLLDATVQPKETFFDDLAGRIKESERSSALLFVHGYNVTFENAARRTAQMAYDMGFDGAPVFYSWPSRGKLLAYLVDEQNMQWSEVNLRAFLEDFFERSSAENVYVVAHSMGNRGLTRALSALLAQRPEFRARLTEVILAAPDIDADVFRRDIAPALVATGRPVTLYASSEDVALAASKEFNGYPRAGDSGDGLVLLPGIETVDATGVDTGFLRHSYFAEVRSMIGDMFQMIVHRLRANERFGLVGIDTEEGRYWKFRY